MLKASVSGSFHRHMDAIVAAVIELESLSVRVLSPADPRIVAKHGDFLFVASDRVRSVRLVQDRHFESVRAADFLWLVCPDGYVGQSASMEIGFAAGAGIPIYAARPPGDLTLRQYVTIQPTLTDVLRAVSATSRQPRPEGLLIDPHASVEQAHRILERIGITLTGSRCFSERTWGVHRDFAKLQTTLRLPTCVQ